MAKPKRKISKKRPASRRPRKPQATAASIKSLTAGDRPEKAAIRSAAFAKAILDAKSYTADPASLRELFKEASVKAAAIPSNTLEGVGPYLQAMLRLLRAYAGGDYRKITKDALLTIVAAVSYLVDPFDLIPDEIPFLGFIDDVTVISFAVTRTRDALDAFMLWETAE
jgi:uncharacterized membrane protein YkvA (DUF1232 family)